MLMPHDSLKAAPRVAFFAALVAGGLHTAAFAPFDAWWLQILALASLAGLGWSAEPRRAALLGFGFGLGWLSSGLWWLHISMHQFGGIPWLLAALAVLLLAAFLSSYYAAMLALWAALRQRAQPGPAAQVLMFAAIWLLAELLRATVFGGFPWIASGYAHTVGPLARGRRGLASMASRLSRPWLRRRWRLWPCRPCAPGGRRPACCWCWRWPPCCCRKTSPARRDF